MVYTFILYLLLSQATTQPTADSNEAAVEHLRWRLQDGYPWVCILHVECDNGHIQDGGDGDQTRQEPGPKVDSGMGSLLLLEGPDEGNNFVVAGIDGGGWNKIIDY